MKPAWLKRVWIWLVNPIERSRYFTEEGYQRALRRRRDELRPFKIGAMMVVLIIMAKVYPQSVVVGTLIEFAFFGACGLALVYFCLLWYEGDRLPHPPPGQEDYFHSPEWDKVSRFSVRAGIVIGIIAVIIVGPVTPEQAIKSFSKYTSEEADDDSSVP